MTGARQAELLSQLSGREIRYVEQPLEELRAFNEEAALITEWLGAVGYEVDIAALHRDHPEVAWHSFEQWAHGRDWSVLKEKAAV